MRSTWPASKIWRSWSSGRSVSSIGGIGSRRALSELREHARARGVKTYGSAYAAAGIPAEHIAGDMSAISRIEHTLPTKGMELGLLTMMKRTASHVASEFCAGYTLEYTGIDTPGTLSKVTRFFADNNISICSLKSDTFDEDEDVKMRCELEFNIPVEVDIDKFKVSFEDLSRSLNVDYIFRRIR